MKELQFDDFLAISVKFQTLCKLSVKFSRSQISANVSFLNRQSKLHQLSAISLTDIHTL